jgi:hypothetical protein
VQGVYNALVCCLCRHAVLWLHVCISLRNYTCVRAMSSISDAIKYCAKAGDEKDYIKWSSKVSKVDDYGRVSCHPVPHLRIAVCVCLRVSLSCVFLGGGDDCMRAFVAEIANV